MQDKLIRNTVSAKKRRIRLAITVNNGTAVAAENVKIIKLDENNNFFIKNDLPPLSVF